MARVRRQFAGGRWRVSIHGALSAADLRRVELACGPALASRPLPLDIEVKDLTSLDEASRLFLWRLLQRGAALRGRTAELWQERIEHPAALGSPSSRAAPESP